MRISDSVLCSFPLSSTFVVSSQALSVVSWRSRYSCGSDLRVKEFDAVAEVLRPLCPTTLVDGRVHRLSVSVIFGISVFLQPSVELEVAPCSVFLRSIALLLPTVTPPKATVFTPTSSSSPQTLSRLALK